MVYLRLLIAFLQVGLFTFGGGYASLPLMQDQAVGGGWMTLPEFSDMLAISQMTPGPVAINLATFVGLRMGGVPGAVVATVAYAIPSFVIVSVMAALVRRYGELRHVQNAIAGLKPGVVGLIFAAGLSIVLSAVLGNVFPFTSVDWVALILFAGAFAALRRFKRLSPLLVISICGAAGGVLYTV